MPARAKSTTDRRQARARPSPRRCTQRRSGGAGSRDRTDTLLLVYWAPAPAPASPSPDGGSQAPQRPPAALPRSSPPPSRETPAGFVRFRKLARGGRQGRSRPTSGTATPLPATSGLTQAKGGRRGADPSGVAWPPKPPSPRSSRTSRIPPTARVTGRSRLYLKCSFFICRLKTNLEEAKSKTCPLPLAT